MAFGLSVLLSMAVCFVSVSKMARPVLSQCSSGGKATSWWCLCSRAQHSGGNILLHAIRWRRKDLPHCKTWRAFVFAACISGQVLPQGQYGRPCHADIMAVCHVDVLGGGQGLHGTFLAGFAPGGPPALLKMACISAFAAKVKGGMVSVGLPHDPPNQAGLHNGVPPINGGWN